MTNVIGAGQFHSLAIVDNGDGTYSYWAWGMNESGQLGIPAGEQEISLVQISGFKSSSISQAYKVDAKNKTRHLIKQPPNYKNDRLQFSCVRIARKRAYKMC